MGLPKEQAGREAIWRREERRGWRKGGGKEKEKEGSRKAGERERMENVISTRERSLALPGDWPVLTLDE